MTFIPVKGAIYPTIEVGCAFGDNPGTSSPAYTDITPYVRAINFRRGRQDELATVDSGRLTLTLNNRDGRFMPENASGAYTPNVKPLKRVRVRAQWLAVTYDLIHAYTESWVPSWPGKGSDAIVTLSCVDRLEQFNMLELDGPVYSEALTGSRIGTVLTAIGVPAGDRTIDTGIHTARAEEADPVTGKSEVAGSSLQFLREVAACDPGLIFVASDGKTVFQDRRHRQDDETAVYMTLGDLPGEHGYQEINAGYDTTNLWSEVAVTYLPSHFHTINTEERVGDTTSQTSYFKRTFPISTRLTKPGEAAASASDYLHRFKDPHLRFPSIQLRPKSTETTYWTKVLGLEISKRLTIKRRPQWGGTISQDVHLEGVTHTIVPGGPWDVTLDVSPAFALTEWTLGTSALNSTDVVGV